MEEAGEKYVIQKLWGQRLWLCFSLLSLFSSFNEVVFRSKKLEVYSALEGSIYRIVSQTDFSLIRTWPLNQRQIASNFSHRESVFVYNFTSSVLGYPSKNINTYFFKNTMTIWRMQCLIHTYVVFTSTYLYECIACVQIPSDLLMLAKLNGYNYQCECDLVRQVCDVPSVTIFQQVVCERRDCPQRLGELVLWFTQHLFSQG